MADPIDIHVGRKLRKRRNQMAISQIELAKEVGITFQQIQKYEGASNRISASRLFQLANALNCSVGYFFEGLNGDMEEQERRDMSPQNLRLLRAFNNLPTPDLQRHFLQLIESNTKRSLN